MVLLRLVAGLNCLQQLASKMAPLATASAAAAAAASWLVAIATVAHH